jgi:hypothetical protein
LHRHDAPHETLHLPEAEARRLLLVRAVEEADPAGKLVGALEREQLERQAVASAGDTIPGQPPDTRTYLLARATRFAELLSNRQPRLAALAQPPTWHAWLAWGLPLAALATGALVDRIDNPGQVNLLSPPLLAFLLWNLAVYVGLAVFAVWPRRGGGTGTGWLRRVAPLRHRSAGGLRGAIVARFQEAWWRSAGALEGQRWRATLHASAAAWALGIALSIALGGLVREYRVGWESTLLELPQVHAFLQALFAPVAALLPLEPFTLDEVRRLHFRSGDDVGRVEARRWVFLYLALLALVVVVPRAVLALWARWRQARLARAVPVALEDAYFRQVLGRVRPARILLAIARADGADDRPLRTVLRQAAGEGGPLGPGEPWTLLSTDRGDALLCMDLPTAALQPGRGAAPAPATRWSWARLRASGAAPAPAAPLARADALVLVCDDPQALEALLPALQSAARPVLLLAPGSGSGLAARLRRLEGLAEVLPLQDLPTWRQDARLRAALARLLPPYHAPGMERLCAQWEHRERARLRDAMQLLAAELVQAATDTHELAAAPVGVRQLVVRGERAASHEARQQAIDALLARTRERQAATDARLLSLHRLEGVVPAWDLSHALAERFQVRQAVHEPQAGLAGAASGAAMGAAVDLMTGGLTLGAASALGALVGGGAALVAAAWKNRSTEAGVTSVAIGDEMLAGLLQGALLRYLGAVHEGRAAEPVARERWAEVVATAVEARSDALAAAWVRARTEGAAPACEQLVPLLEGLALHVLADLHGAAPTPAPAAA